MKAVEPSVKELADQIEGTVVIRSDKSVAVQHIVNIIDAVNEINKFDIFLLCQQIVVLKRKN